MNSRWEVIKALDASSRPPIWEHSPGVYYVGRFFIKIAARATVMANSWCARIRVAVLTATAGGRLTTYRYIHSDTRLHSAAEYRSCLYTLQLSRFSVVIKSRGNYMAPPSAVRNGIYFRIWYVAVRISFLRKKSVRDVALLPPVR